MTISRWGLFRAALTACFMLGATALAHANTPCTITVPQPGTDPAGSSNQLSLNYDYNYRRPADERTTVRVTQDASALIVTVDAQQKEPIAATQTTNGSGVMNDDNIAVYLFPQGTTGFAYMFAANPHGTRYQTSSENADYAPDWSAKATATADGYALVMRIPFDVMRTGGSTTWKAQVTRTIAANSANPVWCDDSAQEQPLEPAFAGTFRGVGAQSAPQTKRPKPRLALYGLDELQTGSDAARFGSDLSVPITPTASFLATLHPDYSNVELDQQTIAPTAFPRQYQEVRPFFTQLASYVNSPTISIESPEMLYTPSIPAFSEGYAVEGTQGHYNLGAFDAMGAGRSDGFASAGYGYSDSAKQVLFVAQRVSVDEAASSQSGAIHDDVTYASTQYLNQRSHYFAYASAAIDSGAAVTDESQATYAEEGFGYETPALLAGFSFQHIGPQFAPVDGYVQQADVTGYNFLAARTWTFKPTSELQTAQFIELITHQRNGAGQAGLDQAVEQLNLNFKRQYTLQLSDSSIGTQTTYATPSAGDLAPFSSMGATIGYRTGTSTPTSIGYSAGPYYHGNSAEWSFITTLGLAPRVHLGLEADRTSYAPSRFAIKTWGESGGPEWLERATLDWQFSHVASFDLGARRIVGMMLPNAYQQPEFGTNTSCANAAAGSMIDCSNLSAGFHLLIGHQELYMVYGDPSQLQTKPAFFLKFIQYLGAEKGT